jgi:hypothetical protein
VIPVLFIAESAVRNAHFKLSAAMALGASASLAKCFCVTCPAIQ